MLLALALLAFFGSASSLIYELVFTKILSFFEGDFLLWQCLTLGTYLGALGLGAFFQLRSPNTWRNFLILELGITTLGALSVPLLYLAHAVYRIYFADFGFAPSHSLAFFASCSLVIVALMGFLCGQELPRVFSVGRSKHNVGRSSSFLLAMNYLGALAGALSFGAIFLPHLSMVDTTLSTALINLCMAFGILSQDDLWKQRSLIFAILSVSLLLIFVKITGPQIEDISLKNFYYNRPRFTYSMEKGMVWEDPISLGNIFKFAQLRPTIKRVRTPYQVMDFVPDENPDSDHFALYLNGHYQFETRREVNYHKVMSTGPLLTFHQKPEHILILGGGDGLLARDLLQTLPHLKSITLVELDAKILDGAKKGMLRAINQAAFEDPRIHIVIEDAFAWLRQGSEQKFDAVYADFPYPYDGEVLKLYSLEFYKMLTKKLRPTAFFIADYPLDALRGENANTVQSTFEAAGFVQSWWLSSPGESFIVASMEKKKVYGDDTFTLVELEKKKAPVQSVLKPRAFMKADPFF